MPQPYSPYIPKDVSEVLEVLSHILLSEPTLEDTSGYFPGMSVETEFFALNQGLARVRQAIGQDVYAQLLQMSNKVRAYYENDPDDSNGEAIKGREILLDMEEILKTNA
jgi:hypothetical protein